MSLFRLRAAVMAAGLSSAAMAQTAPDVADLIGARGAGGETQLLARGYEQRQSNIVGDQRFTFWRNNRTGRCISVSTMDGRYAAITAVPPENCEVGADAPVAADSAADARSLVLICFGAGNRPRTSVQPSYRWNESSNRWDWGSEIVSGTEGFNSDVQVEIYGDHGRIHLGPKLVPPIHSGGSNGWWDLYNLVVSADTITASYRLNGMNKPRLTIDRRSGLIQLTGGSPFSGQCDAGDWSGGKRRF